MPALNQPSAFPDSGGADYVLNLIWAFVVLIVILILIVYTIKFLSARNKLWRSGRGIDLLTGIGVGTNRSVQVVEVGNAIYIVGVGENVTLLDKIEDVEQIQQLKELLESRQSFANDPIAAFVTSLRRRNKQTAAEDGEVRDISFQDVFYDKMKRMSDRNQRLEHLIQKQEGNAEDDKR